MQNLNNKVNSFFSNIDGLASLFFRFGIGIAFIIHGLGKFPLPPQGLIDYFNHTYPPIYYLLCEPSQNGWLLVCLQAQKNIFLASSALYARGVNSVPLCDPSQKGCFTLFPHEHQ